MVDAARGGGSRNAMADPGRGGGVRWGGGASDVAGASGWGRLCGEGSHCVSGGVEAARGEVAGS